MANLSRYKSSALQGSSSLLDRLKCVRTHLASHEGMDTHAHMAMLIAGG